MQIPNHYPHIFNLEEGYSVCLYVAKPNLSTLENYSDYLSYQEQTYFNTLNHKRRQLSYLLGRYCAKQALKTYTHHPTLTDWHIKPGIFKQPVIVTNPTGLNLSLSLSHSYTYGAALVFPTTYPMAIDLEIINSARQDIIFSKCSPYERELANDLSTCFLLWTAKEALAKVLKTGLGASFKVYEIEMIKCYGSYYKSNYTYFSQYECISWVWEEVLVSMVKPRKSPIIS